MVCYSEIMAFLTHMTNNDPHHDRLAGILLLIIV